MLAGAAGARRHPHNARRAPAPRGGADAGGGPHGAGRWGRRRQSPPRRPGARGDRADDRPAAAQRGELAVETFTSIVQRRPEFAEGWNKRATVYYLLGEYQKSLADCDEVMKRNPYHFGALSGYGMIYLELDQPAKALDYFQQALGVNPNLESIRQTVEMLKTLLIQRRKDTL